MGAWQRAADGPAEEEGRPKEAPAFVSKPEALTVEEGGWARFVCRVTGFPRPRVMWVVNGQTVMSGTRYKITFDGMWQLDIPKARQYDSGEVLIIAKNVVGEVACRTNLVVKPRQDDYRAVLKQSPKQPIDFRGEENFEREGSTPFIPSRKPEWVVRLEQIQALEKAAMEPACIKNELVSKTVNEMENAVFECRFGGRPKPEVRWYYMKRELRNSRHVQIKLKNDIAQLVLLEASTSMNGEYVCKVFNEAGAATSRAHLTVRELTLDDRDKLAKEHDKEMYMLLQKEEERIKAKEKRREEKRIKKEKYLHMKKEEI